MNSLNIMKFLIPGFVFLITSIKFFFLPLG